MYKVLLLISVALAVSLAKEEKEDLGTVIGIDLGKHLNTFSFTHLLLFLLPAYETGPKINKVQA